MYHLPLTRQTDRLEENLIQAKILQNNTITPLDKIDDITPELSGEIYDGIRYICDFNNCSEIKQIFPNIYKNLIDE